MSYAMKQIRNICLLGHGGSGKTALAESILFRTKMTDRLGKVPEGNTISDYDAEEIRRQISISGSTLFAEYHDHKINILDTPGYFDFSGEVQQALRVADAGIIVTSAKDGCNVGAEKAWKSLNTQKKPRGIYISKIDEENTDFEKAFQSLREHFGLSICPIISPVKEKNSEKITATIDIVCKKAFRMDGHKRMEIPVPEHMLEEMESLHRALVESVAETSEARMDKYFAGETFSTEELYEALAEGIADTSVCPVFCGNSLSGLGVKSFLDALLNLFPAPSEQGTPLDASAPASAVIYKTMSDQYGKFSLFKVLSGTIKTDMMLYNPRTDSNEKMGHIYCVQGKKTIEVSEIPCGDIGAVAKLSDSKTGDTLCMKGGAAVSGVDFPIPCYHMAIAPKVKGQEDKIASGLSKLSDEDLTFSVVNNTETRQMVISGMGDIHLDVLCAKLKSKFGVEVILSPARVPYREKITKKVKVQGRHKKQSGGHGQFGDVWIEFEPQYDTEDLIFEEKIFGGSVPRNFHPAVEKGLRDCIHRGVLAGYPVVFLKATLVDGSYHDVDSSEMAFKLAAALAYKNGLPQAGPVLLEPIGHLKVMVPDAYLGDIMSDLSKRRGNPLGMSAEAGMQIVEAQVPMAEMSSYAIDLRSMTQGRGDFTFSFAHYEEAPMNIQQRIIAEAGALHAEG